MGFDGLGEEEVWKLGGFHQIDSEDYIIFWWGNR